MSTILYINKKIPQISVSIYNLRWFIVWFTPLWFTEKIPRVLIDLDYLEAQLLRQGSSGTYQK